MERTVVLDELLQQLMCFGFSLSRLFKGVDDSLRPRLAFVFKSQLFLFFGFLFCDNNLFGFFALLFCFIDFVGHLTVIFHIVLLLSVPYLRSCLYFPSFSADGIIHPNLPGRYRIFLFQFGSYAETRHLFVWHTPSLSDVDSARRHQRHPSPVVWYKTTL